MSMSSAALPSDARSVQRLEDVMQAVRALEDKNALEAIPELARFDRTEKWWLSILARWLLKSAVALAVMASLVAFLVGAWTVGMTALSALANEAKPGLGDCIALVATGVTMLVLFRDERFAEVAGVRLGLPSVNLAWPLRLGVWCAKLLTYLMIALAAGGILAVALSPLVLASLDFGVWLSDQLQQVEKIIVYVRDMWPGILSVTATIFFAVLGVRSVRRVGVTLLNVILMGGWGLSKMVGLAGQRWNVHGGVVVGVVLAACLVYRSGLAFSLGRSFTLPFRWLYSSAWLLTKRVQLRMLLGRATGTHRRRNLEATGGDWRTAVCSECLARFEQRSEHLSYGRRLRYVRCRICHSDLHCYTGVRRIEGRLDRGVTSAREQVEDMLKIDLLATLESNAPNMPMDLDEIVIGDAVDEDVERFIVAYGETKSMSSIAPLGDLSCRIEPQARLAEITLRNLREAFRHVATPLRTSTGDYHYLGA